MLLFLVENVMTIYDYIFKILNDKKKIIMRTKMIAWSVLSTSFIKFRITQPKILNFKVVPIIYEHPIVDFSKNSMT